MPIVDEFVKRFGRQSYLAVALLSYLLVDAFFANTPVLTYSILALMIVAGPLATAGSLVQRLKSIVLAVLMVTTGYAAAATGSVNLTLAAGLIAAGFFLDLMVTISRGLLFEQTRVTGETLWAAINIYVLLGLFFAFLYSAVLSVWPHAFAGGILDSAGERVTRSMVYYSFVTMTTLGYGDITPKIHAAATLAYLQALIGQLYVAILIARLVSLYNVQNAREEEGKDSKQ